MEKIEQGEMIRQIMEGRAEIEEGKRNSERMINNEEHRNGDARHPIHKKRIVEML